MSNFSFSHSVFYPSGELSASIIKFEIAVCNSFILKSLKFVVWERVKRRRTGYGSTESFDETIIVKDKIEEKIEKKEFYKMTVSRS